MKRSASSRGSMAHIGTTPCKYMVEFVISHVDGIKTADEVCLVWERRGKTIQTQVAKVSNQTATFRETLSMETTLFRRVQPNSKIEVGAAPKPGEVLVFDEKKAKFSLRKGAPNGKALGKIALNLSDYIKALEDTKFVDLKLSNGSKVSVKINSKFLHVGKKKKEGEGADAGGGSDNESMISDMNAPDDDDSIFGDDADSQMSMEIDVVREMESMGGTKHKVPLNSPAKTPPPKKGGSSSAVFSPVSSDGKSSPFMEKTGSRASKRIGSMKLKESPSIRSRSRKKDKDKDKEELQKVIAQLKDENKKLKSSKKAAVEEIDALRDELTSIEELKDQGNKSPKSQEAASRKTAEEMKSLRKQIKELRNQNANLVEELEEIHKEQGGSDDLTEKLRNTIGELKIALEREPKFMDVVNELKVQKVSLALANMEREQAEFALKQYKAGLLK